MFQRPRRGVHRRHEMGDMVEKYRARFGQLGRHRHSPHFAGRVAALRPAIKLARPVFAKRLLSIRLAAIVDFSRFALRTP